MIIYRVYCVFTKSAGYFSTRNVAEEAAAFWNRKDSRAHFVVTAIKVADQFVPSEFCETV